MNIQSYDLVVIGAGPAGLSAAREASACGLTVAIVDEQREAGGQIYRAVGSAISDRPEDAALLGDDYVHGGKLTPSVSADGVTYLPGHTVWQIERDGEVWCTDGLKAKSLKGERVLLATGAMERPVPVPGWTLPGVMTAGAAQILLKSTGMIPDGPVAIIGAGPLLLLVADQLSRAGAEIAVVAETTSFADYVRGIPHLLRAMKASDYLAKGFAMRSRLKKAGVRIESGIRNLRITGDDRVTGISFERGGAVRTVEVNTALLHQGVVPNTQASRQLRLNHKWHAAQRYWYPETDAYGATDVEAIFVAGDGGGIYGALAAEAGGALAALKIAEELGKLDASERRARAEPHLRAMDKNAAIRPLLDAMFAPPKEVLQPPENDTLVCRCEEITAGQIRDAARLGAPGPNQLKAFLRCGMGPCQGRMCGLTVAEILAAEQNLSPETVGAYRIRPPLKPISLSELAEMGMPRDTEQSVT